MQQYVLGEATSLGSGLSVYSQRQAATLTRSVCTVSILTQVIVIRLI